MSRTREAFWNVVGWVGLGIGGLLCGLAGRSAAEGNDPFAHVRQIHEHIAFAVANDL